MFFFEDLEINIFDFSSSRTLIFEDLEELPPEERAARQQRRRRRLRYIYIYIYS